MIVGNEPGERILVAIPAYNEEGTIEEVIRRVRESLPDFDLLVVNDGSRDATGEILDRLGVVTATHLCNLGYGRAIQTAITVALANGRKALAADREQIRPEYEQTCREK